MNGVTDFRQPFMATRAPVETSPGWSAPMRDDVIVGRASSFTGNPIDLAGHLVKLTLTAPAEKTQGVITHVVCTTDGTPASFALEVLDNDRYVIIRDDHADASPVVVSEPVHDLSPNLNDLPTGVHHVPWHRVARYELVLAGRS